MKSVDPTKRYTYTPDYAPEVTVTYVQPWGVTVPDDGGKQQGFFNLYLDRFIVSIEGLERTATNKDLPWSQVMPPLLANDMFTRISTLGHLDEAEQEG